MNLLHEVSRWSTTARAHVRRRGFAADVAADAVQNALLALAQNIGAPDFVPPINAKAFLFARSVKEAHALIRDENRAGATSGGVGGERVPTRVPIDKAGHVMPQDLVGDDDVNAHERDPEWSDRTGDRETIRTEWSDAVSELLAELLPQDRMALENEFARTRALDPSERKRLARARHRARAILARVGVRHAFPVALRRCRRRRPASP